MYKRGKAQCYNWKVGKTNYVQTINVELQVQFKALTTTRSRQGVEYKNQQDLDRNHLRHQYVMHKFECV